MTEHRFYLGIALAIVLIAMAYVLEWVERSLEKREKARELARARKHLTEKGYLVEKPGKH